MKLGISDLQFNNSQYEGWTMNPYRLYHQVLDYAGGLAPQQWIVILAVIILIGAFFLRGFGSRAKY